MDDKNVPTPDKVLSAINDGKSYTLSQIADHWIGGLSIGYKKLLVFAGATTTVIIVFGLFIVMFGFFFNSSSMKKWGWGAVLVPPACFAGMILVPIVISYIKGHTLP